MKDLKEHLFIGDFSTDNSIKKGDSTNISETSIHSENSSTIDTTQNINNSIETTTTSENNSSINSSMQITDTNTTHQNSILTVNSQFDTYNYDQSSTNNNTTSNIENEMINTCGASVQEASQAINIATNESINNNIMNSNTIINSSDVNVFTDIRLESDLTFLGDNVDKKCMIESMNKLKNEAEADNSNAHTFSGGEGGDTMAEFGGNVSENSKKISSSDSLDSSMSNENATIQSAKTDLDATNDISTTADFEVKQTNDKTKAGGIHDITFIFIILILIFFYYLN